MSPTGAACRRNNFTRLKPLLESRPVGRVAALLLTLALHVMLLSPAFPGDWGLGARESRTKSHASAKPTPLVLTWIDLAGSSTPTNSSSLSIAHLQSLKLRLTDVEMVVEDGTPIVQNDSVPEYVLRMAALTARIQALWKLPRTLLAADFHCRARLRPGGSGSVDEVEMESCDASGPVRASIAQAIERAMPLPLPQERQGVSADIVLQFTAYAGPNGTNHTSIEPAAN